MIEILRDLPYKTYTGLFICGLLASYWLIPRIIWFAKGLRLYSKARESKSRDELSLGGIAIALPFILGISLMLLLRNQTSDNMYMVPIQMRGLFFGACAILTVGLIQDILSPPRILNIALQVAIGCIAYYYHFQINLSALSSFDLGLVVNIVLTVLWILALINIFDLLQHIYQQFPSLVLLFVLSLLGVAFVTDHYRAIVVYCLLTGSLFGYLSHDSTLRPVLGSTGAYFIGFILAITILQSEIASLFLVGLVLCVMAIIIISFFLFVKNTTPFSHRLNNVNTTHSHIRSMYHYATAICLRLQIAKSHQESWKLVCDVASEFGYSYIQLEASSGEIVFASRDASIPAQDALRIPLPLSGGTLCMRTDSPSDWVDEQARFSHFQLVVDEFDRWRAHKLQVHISERSNPNKVLIVNRYYGGMAATGQLVEELAEDLHRAGIDVTVLTGDLSYGSHVQLHGKNEIINGIHIRRISSTQFGRSTSFNRIMDFAFFYLFSLEWALKTKSKQYTHILTFTDPPLIAAVGLVTKKMKDWKFIYCVQDLYPDTALALDIMRPGVIFHSFHKLNQLLLRNADAIVSISQSMHSNILDQIKPQNTVQQIANWSDGNKIAPIDDLSLRGELKLRNIYTVLFAGNMGIAQGVHTLVELIKACKDWNHIQFLFVGGGVLSDQIANAIAEHSIGNAKMMDYQRKNDLKRLMAICDIGVVSLSPAMEGLALPSKTYTYLAAGLPILSIGAENSDLKGYAQQGLGVHFTPDELENIVNFLDTEARNGSRFTRADIRKTFEENFTRSIQTEQYISLIKNL